MGEFGIADFKDFRGLDIRVGEIISASDLENARNPAYVLQIDFGAEIGVLKSSAQITSLYKKSEVVGKQVVAVVNFEPKQIGSVMSECLVLGAMQEHGVVLLTPDQRVEKGSKIG
jgi:tRNA-binding protein